MAFTCPRCRQSADARFYGPCPSCRDELRASSGSEARAVERTTFEPAVHVTPNAVALRED